MVKVKLLDLFLIFFKISIISIGGGLTMLPMIDRYLVEDNHYMTKDDVVDAVALTQSMPGIIAANLACFCGMKIAGFAGAITALFGVVLAPFLVILMVVMFLGQLKDVAALDYVFAAVRAAVGALILVSGIKIAQKTLKNYFAVIITVVSFILLAFTSINAIYIIIGGALLGVFSVLFRIKKSCRPVE